MLQKYASKTDNSWLRYEFKDRQANGKTLTKRTMPFRLKTEIPSLF